MFEDKITDIPFIRQDGDSFVPQYRIFIEKRTKVRDHVGEEGIFVIVPNGETQISTSGSIDGNPGSASITMLKGSDCYYLPFGNQKNQKQIDNFFEEKNRKIEELEKAKNAAAGSIELSRDLNLDSFQKIVTKERQEKTFKDQFEQYQKQIQAASNSNKFEFFLPNRDPSIQFKYNQEEIKNRLKEISVFLPEIVSDVSLSQETLLSLENITNYFYEIESGDLVYIDTYSKRKNKMLPTFTGVITRKRETGSAGGIETFQFDCEDYSYFLKNSQYLYSPTVFNDAQRKVLLGEQPPGTLAGKDNKKYNLSADKDAQAAQISIYQSNLMNKSAFEAFLALILTSRFQDNPFDFLDDDGRIVKKIGEDKIYSILPLRAPLLSRIERILAYPLTKEIAQQFQFLQGSSKTRHELILELARNLEVEFFFAETGEPVLKFPTRIDAFKFMPPVNLLPGNNLGVTRVHDRFTREAKGSREIDKIYAEVINRNLAFTSTGTINDESRDSAFIEKQLITSSIYINLHSELKKDFTVPENERGELQQDLVTLTKSPKDLVNKVLFKPYQKKNWDDYLYVDPKSEYLDMNDRITVLSNRLQADRLTGVDREISTQYSADFRAETKKLPRPTVNLDEVNKQEKSISKYVLEGGEIPTLYDDDLISWDFEDNVEEVFTSGFVTIQMDYVPAATADAQMSSATNRGRYFVDVAGAEKYGVRYRELNPQFFREQYYAALYAYTKLAIVNQERYRAQVTAINDPFIRIGTPIKIHMRRNVKIRRIVPSKPLSVFDYAALSKDKSYQFDDSKQFEALRFNTETNSGDIIFEEHEVQIPCVYYINSISRTLPVGDGLPTMQLQLTAGRPEFNSKVNGQEINDAEDQWVRGFYFFYRNFLFSPYANLDPYISKLEKDDTQYKFQEQNAISNRPSKNTNRKVEEHQKQQIGKKYTTFSGKVEQPKGAFAPQSGQNSIPEQNNFVLKMFDYALSLRAKFDPNKVIEENTPSKIGFDILKKILISIPDQLEAGLKKFLKSSEPSNSVPDVEVGTAFFEALKKIFTNYDLYRFLFSSKSKIEEPFKQEEIEAVFKQYLGIELRATQEELDTIFKLITDLINKELMPEVRKMLKKTSNES